MSSSRVCRVMIVAAKSTSNINRNTFTAAATSRWSSTESSPPSESSENPTKKRVTGIMKPFPVSPLLGDFMGVSQASRPEVMKKIWAYIKLHNLQSPSNKRIILCDEKLMKIFDGKEQVEMLQIAKLVTPHLIKT